MKNPQLLKINTLPEGNWRDNDSVMLHACFALLTDCIENEDLLTGHVDWTATDEYRNIKKEIEALYGWWNKRKELYKTDDACDGDLMQYDEDDAMLIRLIKIRRHLWT